MEILCDYCGVLGTMVYCESDSAKLCLHCDKCVHSANSFSQRHSRALICEKCNSQPAVVRCMDDKIILCQVCEWNACSGPGHRTQKLNSYTDCPTIDEFSNTWPSLLELPYPSACDLSSTPVSSSLIVNENSINCLNECSSVLVDNYNRINKLSPSIKIDNVVGPSTVVPLNSNNVPHCDNDQPLFFPLESGSNLPKAASPPQQDCITFQYPGVNGSASLIHTMSGGVSSMLVNTSCDRNIGMPFPAGPLSLTTITGESHVAGHQDCGLLPVFLAGESPWESSLDTSSPQARDKAKMRYNEKKRTRMFGKQIRYASRKARADTRKRVKGRFVKTGEAYDYDPLRTRI